jgi:ABC-type transport system involved in multi-copper enzyme maturation permease subunit
MAFQNLIQIAFLLHAALAPLAMGLSLTTIGGRPIVAWVTGFVSLVGIQLCYAIITGLAAVAIVNSNGQYFSDAAFLFILAFFGPWLAYAMASGGGKAVYDAVDKSFAATASFVSNAVSAAAKGVM